METLHKTGQARTAGHLPVYKIPVSPRGVFASDFTLQLPIAEKFLATPVRLPEIWPITKV